jgi:hypothetical protein
MQGARANIPNMAVRPAVTAPNVSLLSCDSIPNDGSSASSAFSGLVLLPHEGTGTCEHNGDEPRDSQSVSSIGGPTGVQHEQSYGRFRSCSKHLHPLEYRMRSWRRSTGLAQGYGGLKWDGA